MKKKIIISIVSLLQFFGISCTTQSPQTDDHITADDIIKKKIHLGNEENITLIDLRTPMEIRKTGIIPGAQIKNYFSTGLRHYIKGLPKDKKYIVYCKSGGRSAKMASKMKKQGLDVVNYKEGIDGWLSQKHQTLPHL